jgi:uncharacterized protein
VTEITTAIAAWHQLWSGLPLGGRLLLFAATWVGLWLPWAVPIAWRLGWIPFAPLAPAQKLPLLAPLYLVAPLVLWAIDQPWASYGWRWLGGWDLAAGWLIAVLGLALVFTWEARQGWLQWQGAPLVLLSSLLKVCGPIALLALWISGTEELLFRGWLQQQLAAAYGVVIAAAIASAIFALLHLLWERQQTIPQLPGLWLMGLVLTLALGVNGGALGLAIGLHAGWVWGLTCLDAAAAIAYAPAAPDWIVGYYRQPLGGLAGLLCLGATAALLWIVVVVAG